MQKTYSPSNYHFQWTEDWYTWNRKAAHSAALKARNEEAKRLKQAGYKVIKSTHKDCLMSKGGIGSGHPHIEMWCNVYMIDAVKEN